MCSHSDIGHGAELSYVFHTYVYTEQEKQLADKVSAYWGNFVNTGNPNIPPEHKDVCDGDGCMVSACSYTNRYKYGVYNIIPFIAPTSDLYSILPGNT